VSKHLTRTGGRDYHLAGGPAGAMRGLWKKLVLKSLPLYDVFEPAAHAVELRVWALRGRPAPPPPAFKQRTVAGYARLFSLTTLVETGTFLGDMARAGGKTFRRVITIELDEDLYEKARRRLARFPNITVLRGNSGELLPGLLSTCRNSCLFWLDAHYSGRLTARGGRDTPIVRELGAVLAHPGPNHVVLIDDARCFTGEGDYPDLETLKRFVRGLRPDWGFEVRDDIIRCHGCRPLAGGGRLS
jgi:hypothetical protein